MTEQHSNSTPETKRRPGPLGRWARRMEHALACCSAAFLLFILSPIPRWMYEALDCQDELKKADLIICLGGGPSRVIESARLLNEGWADRLIVSNHGRAGIKMRELAIDWGADPRKVIIDGQSTRTLDHPAAIARTCGVSPSDDRCIVVTSYEHMMRSKATFEKAGYKNLVMREPRWERDWRSPIGFRNQFRILHLIAYEYSAMGWYWLLGAV